MGIQSSWRVILRFCIFTTSFWIAGCNRTNNQENTWSAYKADAKSTSYSSLDQINLSNVSQLVNTWTFQMHDLVQGEDPVSSQSNPIIVDGVMYVNSVSKLFMPSMQLQVKKSGHVKL